MTEKFFPPESGDNENGEYKELPPRLKEALERFRKKRSDETKDSESSHNAEEPNIDADMAQLHQDLRVIEENFFEIVLDGLIKKGAPENEIEGLKNDYREYTECWDKAFTEKGEELSVVKDVYPKLPSSNIWLQYSKRIAEKYFGIERN